MTAAEQLEKLLGAVDEADLLELQILQSAVESTRSAYQTTTTASNKKDWDVAREGLQETIDRLWPRYMVQDERLDNRKAVLSYLNENGYSLSQGKLYADAKKGLLKLQPDKSVLMSSVEAYVSNPGSGLVKHDEAGQSKKDQEKSQKKLDHQLSILATKDAKASFDFDKEKGLYLLREDFELELASRAAVLETGFKHRFKSKVGEWIQMCGGSQDKRSALLDDMLKELDIQLNEFATTDKFQVMFIPGSEDDDL
jgi:hypothetical protein